MQLVFLNPLWWIAALAAAPLLAHLFSKVRPRRVPFPSVRLLQAAARKVARVETPRDRWLLLLRTLAILALLAAFLLPMIRATSAANESGAKTAIVLIDASASMGMADGPRSRFAVAKQAADQFLTDLPAGALANVIWIRNPNRAVLPEPGANKAFLRAKTGTGELSFEQADVAGAFELARRQLENAQGKRELFVISDFQSTSWANVVWPSDPRLSISRHAVTERSVGNVAVSSVEVSPSRPVAGQPARVEAHVRNHSDQLRRVTAYLEVDEQRNSQDVELAPWSEGIASFPVTFPAAGLTPASVSVGNDDFPADDTRQTICDVRDAFVVAVLAPETDRTGLAWARALRALPFVKVERIENASKDNAKRFDVIFASNPGVQDFEFLNATVAIGCRVVVLPSPTIRQEDYADLFPRQEGGWTFEQEERALPGWSVVIATEDHPVFAIYSNGDAGDPAAGRFARRIVTRTSATSRTLLAFEDGKPAIAELVDPANNVAPCALWLAPLDGSSWLDQGAFVAFMGEFTRHLASTSGNTLRSRTRVHQAGALPVYEPGPAVDPESIRLVDSKFTEFAIAAVKGGAGSLIPVESPPPGVYTWMADGAPVERDAILFPERESDLRIMPETELATNAAGSSAARTASTALRDGLPLWPWCIAAASLFFLLEAAIAWAFSRSSQRPAGAES